jgi:hypothetical protein
MEPEPTLGRAWKAGEPVRLVPAVMTLEDAPPGEPAVHGSLREALTAPAVLGVVVEDVELGAARATVETLDGERLSVDPLRLLPVAAEDVESVLRRLERAGVIRRRPGR